MAALGAVEGKSLPPVPDTARERAFLKSRTLPVRAALARTGFLAVAGGVALVGQYGLLASVLADALVLHVGLPDLAWRLAAMLALIVSRGVIAAVGEREAVEAGERVKRALRRDLAAHLVALGPVRLAGDAPGALASTLVDGVEAIEPYYTRFMPTLTLVAWLPLAVLAAVLLEDRLAALIMALTAPLVPLFMVLIGRGAERMNQRQWAHLLRMSGRFLDAVQNLAVLKWFNASRAEIALVARASEDYREATMAVLRIAFLSSLALEFFATLGVALVAVAVGFRLLWGEIGFAQGLFVLLVVPEFYLPLRTLGLHHHARMEAVGAVGPMVDLLGRRAGDPMPEGGVADELAAPPAVWFEDVALTYPDGRAGLTGVGFRLEPGRITALVGPSGAGKSSVATLMLRFMEPSAGTIRIDGLPLRAWNATAWRRNVAWVPQRPHLFQGSVADNIRLGLPGADDEAVRRAARSVGADAFITALPGGYAQPVGEHGCRLSGGQIRLVALARAALRDARLLILDEPTANLDAMTERAVTDAIRTLARGRTVLLIAHRPEAVRMADAIVRLGDGRAVMGEVA